MHKGKIISSLTNKTFISIFFQSLEKRSNAERTPDTFFRIFTRVNTKHDLLDSEARIYCSIIIKKEIGLFFSKQLGN